MTTGPSPKSNKSPSTTQDIVNDRLWFKQNINNIVRFRPEFDQEFAPLLRHGSFPPQFISSHMKNNLPFDWVVVVDVQRMLGTEASANQAETAQLRLRIQTIATPQLKDQRLAEKELTRAIAAELLLHADQSHVVSRRQDSHDTNAPQSQAA